ncbi:hypothetical protein [Erysipelothrix amsterdamensis]|uniref:hypothetical protein n=1 Tax=Erysipelothrix amsterdamensis TaxID=2929157 RepID=UPI0020A80F08
MPQLRDRLQHQHHLYWQMNQTVIWTKKTLRYLWISLKSTQIPNTKALLTFKKLMDVTLALSKNGPNVINKSKLTVKQ